MGFLHGIRQIGEYYEERNLNNDLQDILNYLKLPLGTVQNLTKDRYPREIRIALKAVNPLAQQLEISAVGEISLADYLGGGAENDMLWKYLYKDPPGANVPWRFSPIYKLGAGQGKNALNQLLPTPDTGSEWINDKNTRYYKLNKVLKGFEETGCFADGSAALIMQQLSQRAQELADLWDDKKRSYIIVFGVVAEDGHFLFPGELPAFLIHFRKKKGATETQPTPGQMRLTPANHVFHCSLCHDETNAPKTMDEIFGFSTFDKLNFLPSLNKKNEMKVFPICERCASLLSRGKTETENKSYLNLGMKNLKIWVVPEVIGYKAIKQLVEDGIDYLGPGVENEEDYLEILSEKDSSFVYHFLFIEKNQAQLILHRLIEDVPPSRFRKLKKLWQETYIKFYPEQDENHLQTLDKSISQITATLLSLAGKTDADKGVMKDNVLTVLAALLQNQRLEVNYFKKIAVSRFPALFTDEDWLIARKGHYSGATQLNRLWMLFEFLTNVNQNLETEEIFL